MKKYRAILKINGKAQAYPKLAKTPQSLMRMLRGEGIPMNCVEVFEEVEVSEEKQRGRQKSKH